MGNPYEIDLTDIAGQAHVKSAEERLQKEQKAVEWANKWIDKLYASLPAEESK